MDAVKGPVRNSTSNLTTMKPTSLHVPEPSLGTLIVWNFSKALEKSPTLNLKEAVISAQSRLEDVSDDGDIQTILSENPYERHLACALLAWQQLGHRDVDSLCRFVENKTVNEERPSKSCMKKIKEEHPSKSCNQEPFDAKPLSKASNESKMSCEIVTPEMVSLSQNSEESRYEEAACLSSFKSFEAGAPSYFEPFKAEGPSSFKPGGFSSFNSFAMGPVVKLPDVNKIVMRMDNTSRCRGSGGGGSKKPRASEKDTIEKIEQACCIESICAERLAAMDVTTTELRNRAGMLARREAERVELLERAEAAWKELERGYQRRLALAEEKEEDIAKQITKMLEERVNYKNACIALTKELKDRTVRGELERGLLSELEKQVCERACLRMKASEESSRLGAVIAEQGCKAAQLDRDLQFKEEQARRNVQSLQSEVAAVRAMTTEAERATRGELAALRDQIAEVSAKLLAEDALNENTKAELEDLRQEKMEIIEDLEGCKALCDGRMQVRMDELTKKREELAALREKVMECRCQLPVSVGVEAKRTASLAALCKCSPEDKILESCSCTSMRSKLLTNLFSDLFGGLQGEMTSAVTLMPCQLLKCLEDKHNWDRASDLKTHLKNYFSKLLVEELDIAIATSIENYHAKWVGLSCADAIQMTPGPDDNPECEGWEQRAVERRAKTLATQLAEQLFQERAEELTQRARDIVNAGPPPCACNLKGGKAAPVQYNKVAEGCQCGPQSRSPSPPRTDLGTITGTSSRTNKPVYWHQMKRDVTQLRLEVEDLKKGGGPPERDLNVEVDRKLVKKPHGKVHGRDTKKNSASVKNAVTKEYVTPLNLAKHSLAAGEALAPAPPPPWQRAIQDFSQLRCQMEHFKKEYITKEDLKMMENKITKIIHRASEGASSTKPKMKQILGCNRAVGASKHSRINKAGKDSGLYTSDIERPTTNRKRIFDSLSREIKKPNSIRGINKPYKKNNTSYAINVCLCSMKRRKQQKDLLERHKLEQSTRREKKSKEFVVQMSSSMKKSNPVSDSIVSEDFSSQIYNKEYNETLCPSKCACFHKIPSNKSIDKLLASLAKWKGNLDASFTEKQPFNNFSKNSIGNSQSDNIICTSKTSIKLKTKPQEVSVQKRQDLLRKGSEQNFNIQETDTELYCNISARSIEPATITDSVYIAAVNLDKSHDELCECSYNSKKTKQMPFKCIQSNKCTCEKSHELKDIEGKIVQEKEKHKERLNRTKQEKRIKNIALPFTPNMLDNEEIKKVKSHEKAKCSKIVDIKDIVVCPFKTSDYQINFLGVTVADFHPKEVKELKAQTHLEKRDRKNTSVAINVVSCGTKCPNNNKESRNLEHRIENYSEENKNQFPELAENVAGTDNIGYEKNIMNRNNENKRPICFIDNCSKNGKEMFKKQYEFQNNVNNNSEEEISLSNIETPDMSQLSHFDCRIPREQTTNKGFDICQSQNLYEKTNSNTKNCYKSDHYSTSENNDIFGKLTSTTNDLPEDLTKINQTSLYSKSMKPETNTKMLPCECNLQLMEFKKLLHSNLTELTAGKDVALDVQSLYFKGRDESCVCCSKLNIEDSGNLEDNAFHLLGQHLKNKVNQLKTSFSIPAEEENKFFDMIVRKVKRLISDSTNEIACKCSTEEGKSEGSWNRAYGLLQEYLKLKIKRVNCSCLLPEDDKDTLPNVLNKINDMIDYDLQRLKNMCKCINDSNDQKNINKIYQRVSIDDKTQNKNVEFEIRIPKFTASDAKKGFNKIEKLNTDSHVPLHLAVDDEYCIYNETCHSTCKMGGSSISSLHIHNKCDSSFIENNVRNTNKTKENTKSFSFDVDCSNAVENNIVRNSTTSELPKMSSLKKESNEKININENIKLNDLSDAYQCNITNSVKVLLPTNICQDSKFVSYILCNKNEHDKSALSINKHSPQSNKEILLTLQKQSVPNSSKVPYYGYTIACSCDDTLGICTCPKNVNHIDPNIINDIWKKSILDKSYFEKISYILPKKPLENKSLSSPHIEEIKMYNQKSATCCTKFEPIVLKTSRYDVKRTHNETNTYNDSTSVETNCSNNGDVEWCECTAQFNPRKNKDGERLKRSIYFPAPIEDFEDHLNYDISSKKMSDKIHTRVCDCEMVPLCHVKMLVENIETKLQNANCTCDSLTPTVCPVHSKMC